MGMIGNYLSVTQEELENYLADSGLLEERIYGPENHNETNLIDIDKSWEGIFFLLTGKSLANAGEAATPLQWVLMPPQIIDPELDMGYGPAFFTTIQQTKEISTALNAISTEELKTKYDGQLMLDLGIYPEIWNDSDSLEYLIEDFNTLKEFYNQAAAKELAVIVFIN